MRDFLSGVLIGLAVVVPLIAIDDGTQHGYESILALSGIFALAGLTLRVRRRRARVGSP